MDEDAQLACHPLNNERGKRSSLPQTRRGLSPRDSQESSPTPQFKSINSSALSLLHSLKLTPKKDVIFITGDWNAKVGSQEIPGVTGKFGPGV